MKKMDFSETVTACDLKRIELVTIFELKVKVIS